MEAQTKSLLERLEERFAKLRARDKVIRKYENEVARHTERMRQTHALRKLSKVAIRTREKWLKEEAAAQIRKEAGIKTIPGFVSKRESAIAFRQALSEKHRAAVEAAKKAVPLVPPPSP